MVSEARAMKVEAPQLQEEAIELCRSNTIAMQSNGNVTRSNAFVTGSRADVSRSNQIVIITRLP